MVKTKDYINNALTMT